MKVEVRKFIGQHCMTREDGQKIYNKIYPQLAKGESVELDFDDVIIFSFRFFNVAIGQLLRDIDSKTLNQSLQVSHLNNLGFFMLRKVIETSKKY